MVNLVEERIDVGVCVSWFPDSSPAAIPVGQTSPVLAPHAQACGDSETVDGERPSVRRLESPSIEYAHASSDSLVHSAHGE
jgi:hypothetical protein